MLTRMRLMNFKSWKDTGDVPLRPITGFFGGNSSGKTSFLQALLLLKQTSESADRGLVFHFGDDGARTNLGGFESVIHNHKLNARMGVEIDWECGEALKIVDAFTETKVVESKEVKFAVQTSNDKSPVVNKMSYGVGDFVFGMNKNNLSGYSLFAKSEDFEFMRAPGRRTILPKPSKCYGFPDEIRAYYQNAGFVADVELAFENLMNGIFYLGPLRAYPKRRYVWLGEQPPDVGHDGRDFVAAILAATNKGSTIHFHGQRKKSKKLEVYVAEWLKKIGLIHAFSINPIGGKSNSRHNNHGIYEVRVKRHKNSQEVLITDVGFGVSQILPVLSLCFYVPEGSTVILEQPEIHLHPIIQSGLADVLIDAWKIRGVQIIIESHSEHLLQRLQRRIAEEELLHNDVNLFFCESKGRQSQLTALPPDEYGNIENWPDDFFGDRFDEMVETKKAELNRKISDEATQEEVQ